MNTKYKFLSNSPIGEDKFEGKSQEKIADVLVNILNDQNFQIIGIDGTWGTGKSNLVEIVKKKMPTHKFFIYDVWGHQEDEQRRAILLELTEALSSENIIKNNEAWKQKLQILLSKKKATTTINQPYLSLGFIFSLLAIIYVPMVNVFVKKDGYLDWSHDWWRVLLVGVPIIAVFGILIFNLSEQIYNGKRWQSFKLALLHTFLIYNNKQEKETKIEMISENEPSVQEFRNWMKGIDNDLKKCKLVIVFDNFDRLPKQHILSIWSSLHVFFSEEKYKNIKVIVPFDRAHIKNAFKDMDGSSGDYSNDYINKTFDLVYRVSPPILSSWKLFFKENWKNAFCNIKELEYLKVEQAYEIIQGTITPREIIAFINEVVSLKLLQEEISERYIAIFVLNKEHILKNPLSAILDLTYLKGLELYYTEDEDYQKNITALAYQINSINALEVVYKKKLKDSLINNDVIVFNELSRTSVFERIIQSVLNEIEDLRNPVEVLNQIQDNSEISKTILNHIWDDMFLRIKRDFKEDGQLNSFHKILLDKINLENKKIWLERIISNLSFKSKDISYFIRSIDELDSFVIEKSIELEVFNILKDRKIEIGEFIILVEEKEKEYSKYKLYCDLQELDEYLVTLQIGELNKALFIEDINESKELESFKNWLISLGTHHINNQANFILIIRLLKHVTNDLMPVLLQDSEIVTLINSTDSKNEFYADLLAMKIKIGPINHVTNTPFYESIFNQIDDEIAGTLISNLSYYMTIDEYLTRTIEFNLESLSTVTQKYIASELYESLIDSKNILDKFQLICEINGLDPDVLFNLIDKFKFRALTFDYIQSLSNYVFEHAIKSETNIAKQMLKTLIEHFDQFNLEQWETIFKELNCREIQLLELSNYSNWNGFALESFKSKMEEMIENGVIESPDKIIFILKSFENSGKDLTNLFKDVRDLLISNRKINENLFKCLFDWMIKYSNLNEKSEDVLRTIIIPSLLESEDCKQILIKQYVKIKSLKDLSKNAFNDFKEGLIARREDPVIEELSKLLEIKISKED